MPDRNRHLMPVKVNADENMLGRTLDPGTLWRECDKYYCKAMTNLPQNPHGHMCLDPNAGGTEGPSPATSKPQSQRYCSGFLTVLD